MKLSLKHVAVFSRIIVDIQDLDGHFYQTADLLTLYRNGWFVTERFGSILSLCKGKSNNEFANRFRRFKLLPDVSLEAFDTLWKQLAEEQFEKNKKFLLNNTRKPYTKKQKVNVNED